MLVASARRGPPEHRLVARVLLAAAGCQVGHRGDVSLGCGPNVLAHLPSIAGSALPKALALAHRSSPSAHDLGSYQAWCSLT
jgi:hypothetical protein